MTRCVPLPCPCYGRLLGQGGWTPHPRPRCPFGPRVRVCLHFWGPYPRVLLSSTWGHAACKAPGHALVDEPSSQAQLSALPEGGPTEENPPCPPLLPWELLESVWSGTPTPTKAGTATWAGLWLCGVRFPKASSILKGLMRGRAPWCSGFEDGRDERS